MNTNHKVIEMRAREGDAESQHVLGWLYFKGLGFSRDYSKAFKWFHCSAIKGNASAQISAAIMYLRGKGTSVNIFYAYAWSFSAKNIDHKFNRVHALICRQMSGSQIAEGQKLFATLHDANEPKL